VLVAVDVHADGAARAAAAEIAEAGAEILQVPVLSDV
jgi:hypothetical protein